MAGLSLLAATSALAQNSLQPERPWPQVYTVFDGPTITVCVACGPVRRSVLQRVAQVDEPAAKAVLVTCGYLLSPSGVRVEQPEYESGNLVVDAGQLGDEYQLVMPVRSGHHFTPRPLSSRSISMCWTQQASFDPRAKTSVN